MRTALTSVDEAVRWLQAGTRGTLRTDSRLVAPGDAFLAWPGQATDGRRFVPAALAAGAAACLVEAEGVDAHAFDDPRVGSLPALKQATGAIADAYFGQPSAQLDVVAATGTNGKTSTAWWTAQALTLLGRRCGVVGTLGIGEPPAGERAAEIAFTGLTTPDPVTLHAGLRRMVDAGFAACAIEASSIGIVEHRLAGLRIAVALFTNFTRDHLDYHGSMEAYWAAKRVLFGWPGLRAAAVNLDDPQGVALARSLAGGVPELWTYSLERDDVRLRARDLGYVDGGLAFTLYEGREALPVRSRLVGDYNAANLLAVVAGLRALDVPLADAVRAIAGLTPVPGRMQAVPAPAGAPAAAPTVIVDYAHTPDALEKALGALRPFAAARGGRLVCVFGCGGNRDASKRPLMAAIAERLADRVVVTSDNPRHEVPAAILADVVAGLARPAAAAVVEDRRAAIAAAVGGADARDVVLIAGKGHEDYQEIAGTKLPFSDLADAQQALAARGGAA